MTPEQIATNIMTLTGLSANQDEQEILSQAYLNLKKKWDALDEPTREQWAAMADAFVLTNDLHHDVAITAIHRAYMQDVKK